MSNQSEAQQKQAGPEFTEFPLPTTETWRKAAEATLKGASFEKKLVTKTYEGIDLQPMYREEDIASVEHLDSLPGFAPYVRGPDILGYKAQPWEVAQELPYSTPQQFNRALCADLERGQTAVNMLLDRATLLGEDADAAATQDVGKGGTSISSLDDLGKALDHVDLEKTPLYVAAGASAIPVGAMVLALVEKQAKSSAQLSGCIGADPLGELAREGKLPRSLSGAYDDMAQFTAWAAANAPQLQTVLVSGHAYHDGGGSAVQELAFTLATGVEYLREMQSRGVAVDQSAPRVRFALSLGSNLFMEVAKLRAARILWAKVVKAFGGNEESQKLRIHARCSGWNKTVYDPNVNMLRATTEAFSGVLGGCDSLHVSPFDEIVRAPTDHTRRVARNTHTVLREEAGLTRTVDPAGGSWYVESLTDSVARKSWDLFREVERQGGMFAALQAGFPQAQIAEVAAQRAKAYAQRRDVFVGTNMYANMSEVPLQIEEQDRTTLLEERREELAGYREAVDAQWRTSALDKLAQAAGDGIVKAAIHAASGGATIGDICQACSRGETVDPIIDPLTIRRGAEAFEALRQRTEAYANRTGSRPKVFLANMGPIPQHKARADFSRGFLEVGAFDVISNDGFASTEDAAGAAIESGAPVVVICSTDKTYPDLVPPLTEQIKKAKPETSVLVAGYPADYIEAFKAAGVDDFIHVRANCYELLENLQKNIGIAP